jgi:diguanylate cyclase (GGDEF)-like protein
MFMDIDNFKTENDNKGHKEGDKILQELSDVIKKSTRNIDIAARFGGDEFCVLLPDVDKNETDIIANRIIDHFHQSCSCNSWDISLSVGVITTDKQFPLEELIKRSDALMYKAKKGGKNRIEHDSI